jgi:hypothetical protein
MVRRKMQIITQNANLCPPHDQSFEGLSSGRLSSVLSLRRRGHQQAKSLRFGLRCGSHAVVFFSHFSHASTLLEIS